MPLLVWQNGAGAEGGQPRIDEGDARTERPGSSRLARQSEGGQRVRSEYCRHAKAGLLIEGHLRAQPIQRQPPLQIAETGGFGIEPDRFVRFDHHEIVQVFALRGEKRRIAGRRRRDLVDVVRDEALQKRAAIGPRDGENASIIK